ncbi:hypothetical protein L195_g001553 [Trifolium pratense]|uniref:Uncharacterized protein n=1 Tax=Trifolium pratense TaxID=57577 RepID=A0A2K3NQ03_TRIPR|nr:hypothetical protein L195_g001553 [Trifolium pratense]
MQGKGTTEDLTFDPEIERTLRAKKKVVRLAQASIYEEEKETLDDKSMVEHNPPPPSPQRRTMGEYCRKIDMEQISLGFRLANPVNFDIKSIILACLRENQFDGRANRNPWDHLSRFSETRQIQKVLNYITGDHKKLRMFAFSLNGHTKD